MTDRPRATESQRFPAERKAVVEAARAGRRRAPIHGLVDFDVTLARTRLAEMDPPGSFTAFVVASVARAAAGHPGVHAYRDWRRRLVVHHHVDVVTIVEVPTGGGTSFPLAHVLRDADIRSVADLSAELRRVKVEPASSPSGRLLYRSAGVLRWVPGATRVLYWFIERSKRVRSFTGTVAVTAVGMFSGGGGHGIGAPTIPSLSVVVGGIAPRPLVVGDAIVPREVLDLTVTVDHLVVDGAPAARFAADLRRIVEGAEALG